MGAGGPLRAAFHHNTNFGNFCSDYRPRLAPAQIGGHGGPGGRRPRPRPPPELWKIEVDPECSSTDEYMSQLHVNEHDSLRIDFKGIVVELTRFELVDSGSEDFKALCSKYPLLIQGHLKEMRRKFKNRVSDKTCFYLVLNHALPTAQ